jgi:SAM-dependent methyltransferase/uncharacterized protein (DUF2062 family)
MKSRFLRIYDKIRGGKLTQSRAIGSIFLGLFIGLLPLYGLHLPLCLGLSVWFGLDGLLAYAAANVSNPFFAPFIIALQVEVGSFVFTGKSTGFDVKHVKQLGFTAFTFHSLVGAVIVAFLGASLGAIITAIIGGFVRHTRRPNERKNTLKNAIFNTIARYTNARAKDRHYVRIKLLTDPLTEQLVALDRPLGHVTDVGCGRGQFGFLLHSTGRVRTLYGFDWDAAKIATARNAAKGEGRFVVADLREPPLEPTDTVLLLDVLHYLDNLTQKRLLSHVFFALRPNGILILRDVNKNRGLSAILTRFFERVGTLFGMNRSDQLVFRSAIEIDAELRELGFKFLSSPSSDTALLDNQLWVYTKQ